MDMTLFYTFILASFLVIIIPGPNVIVIISTSIKHGRKRGLQTVAGTSLAMAIQLMIAGISTSWFIQTLSDGFHILKWIGVAYLVYLGLSYIKNCLNHTKIETEITTSLTFSRGFFVSLTNPKTILFFSAFFPQFVSSSGIYIKQIIYLSLSFLILAIMLDSCYAISSARLKPLLDKNNLHQFQNGLTGLLLIGTGIWLAVSRRAQ